MSMITDPVSAPAYLVQGWRLIQQPGLRRYALAPLAINLLVFTAATALAVWQFNRVIAWSQAQLPHNIRAQYDPTRRRLRKKQREALARRQRAADLAAGRRPKRRKVRKAVAAAAKKTTK